MRLILGNILAVVGLALALFALFGFDTTFASGGGGEFGLPARMHNLGLLLDRELLFQGGCALFLAGVIDSGVARITDALRARSRTDDEI